MSIDLPNPSTFTTKDLERMMQVAFALGQISKTGRKADRKATAVTIVKAMQTSKVTSGYHHYIWKAMQADKSYIVDRCNDRVAGRP